MKEKSVKIIGLSVNQKFGILNACNLQFDDKNRIVKVKGAVGEGKTTLQKSLQLGTQGSKTLVDKNLYGEIDIETQLLDGDIPVFVGCKSSKEGKLLYTLYTKDNTGKKVKEPVIDGVKATPSKYLEMLQTELTWKMDELTSENPNVQKKILLKLYQHKLKENGVIFDRKNPDYKNTILHQIEVAEGKRDVADAIRKQNGGIADDLKARGYDVNRPDTLPVRINIDELKSSLQKITTDFEVEKAGASNKKIQKLQDLKNKASELTNECLRFNQKTKEDYHTLKKKQETNVFKWEEENSAKEQKINRVGELLLDLKLLGYAGNEVKEWMKTLPQPQPEDTKPTINVKEPLYIEFDENNKIIINDFVKEIEPVAKIIELKREYIEISEQEIVIDDTSYLQNKKQIESEIEQSEFTNRICDAVDSFFNWQSINSEVVQLKQKYIKLLSKIDTGVEGLTIVPKENDIFLMYDGSYDTKYFNNPEKEPRKLSSYSGTQKPVICLLIQNYLLNQKPKSMRYMYIDNVPMDLKTITLLENMSKELNLRIFLNITGDFEQNNLTDGEILIEGGEVFFN